MKRLLSTLSATLFCFFLAEAQPAAVKNAAKSVFSLTTFRADGSVLASSHGIFVGENGEAISDLTPFLGASKAVVIDQKGNKMDVSRLLGINEIYDMARFRVDGKTTPAVLAQNAITTGNKTWLVGYGIKNPTITETTVKSTEKFMEKYNYYIISMNAPDNTIACPFVNENGEVVGLLQISNTSFDTHATDARFGNSLTLSALSYSDACIRQIGIPIAMPEEKNQAQLLLMMAGQSGDSLKYESAINDFIEKFPGMNDGYEAKARLRANNMLFEEADEIMKDAIKKCESKDEAHYNYSKLIYDKLLYNNNIYEPWTIDKAMEEANQAYTQNPLPLYLHHIGQLTFSKGEYQNAYDIFMKLYEDKLFSNPELLYESARCKEMMDAPAPEIIALLDSAINTTDTLRFRETAPYFLERANIYMKTDSFRLAVMDYTRYEILMQGRVSAQFYYLREQAEVKGRLFQQALSDIARAIIMDPREALYYAEMASLQIRLNMSDKAEETAQRCVEVAPDYPEGYLLLGLAQVKNGKKEIGIENMQKSKDMGNTQAEGLIQKYNK
ncbi:MAG: hypothetical protein IJ604_05685 [Prevotella sp.]|nr:hypothetical protein [Prevotella sp.]MBR1462856.1 hypothetical protein [Prevotella sp.]